jgi:hypothetical protein
VSLQQVRLDLTHRVKHDAHDDQHAGATEKLCRHVGNFQCLGEQLWQHSDDSEKDRTGEGEARHCEIEEVSRRLARTDAWDKAPILFEIVSDLNRLELRCHPEIAEEENHHAIEYIMEPTDREEVCDLLRCPVLREGHVYDRGGEEQDGLGKNDGHDTRVIDFER